MASESGRTVGGYQEGDPVRRNAIVIAVVSLIIGAFMASMLPVQAHHSDRAMKSRIRNLEFQVADIQGVLSECFYYQGMSQFNDYRSVSGGQVSALDLDTSTAPQFLGLFVYNTPSCLSARKMISGAAKMPKARTR